MANHSQPNRSHKVYSWSLFRQLRIASCLLCHEPATPAQALCDNCLIHLPVSAQSCDKCREPLNPACLQQSDNSALLCSRCQKTTRPYQHCIAPLLYQPPVSNMLQRIKYSGRTIYLRPLAQHLLRALETHYEDQWPEALIPVPLHWWKLRKRGFNQAGVIADIIGKKTGIPVLHHALSRSATGKDQHDLPARERRTHLRGAFVIKRSFDCKHIAIIDDVMTTGATVEEICRVLLRDSPIRQVDIWCLARTPSSQQ